MNADQLRALQAPIKERFRSDPASALMTMKATASLEIPRIACNVSSEDGRTVETGLHRMTGGDGSMACAAHMLLEALIGCAGVTLAAVATAMGIEIATGTISAEGDLDFRGTLGVSRDVPVGFTEIRVTAVLETTADEELLKKLASLIECYCVVAQSLKGPLRFEVVRRGPNE